jgi:hypothetical protein
LPRLGLQALKAFLENSLALGIGKHRVRRVGLAHLQRSVRSILTPMATPSNALQLVIQSAGRCICKCRPLPSVALSGRPAEADPPVKGERSEAGRVASPFADSPLTAAGRRRGGLRERKAPLLHLKMQHHQSRP